MTKLFTSIFAAVFIFSGVAAAQTSWLDRPLNNWNRATGVVPSAPRGGLIEGRCRDQIRTPESLADRAVTRAGWSLYGPAYVYGSTTVVTGMAGTDGMCRPTQYNGFVFVGSRFVGTIAPQPVDARTDGSFGSIFLNSRNSLMVEFARYTSNDALCCPSQKSLVTYSISAGTAPLLKADDVTTSQVCDEGSMQTMDNVVSGTVAYRSRMALPPNAVLTVRLVDVSRADAPSVTIAEQRIETAGKQVPFSFDMAYDRSKIVERNRYSIQAEIRDGGRLLFITDTNYPVITMGNPRVVDIEVVPVGGGTGPVQPPQGSGIIRGTVSYLQRIALAPDSEVRVRLVDAGDPNGRPVSEVSVPTNGRQVPIPFELRYEPRDINRQRNYELYAEIYTNGVLRFRSERGESVQLRSNLTQGIALMVQMAREEPQVITGRTLNLSGLGTGSIKIGDRNPGFVIRVTTTVSTDGTANVGISTISSTTPFRGKLVYIDENTLRIMVESSGNADASGEIEVRFQGTRITSISSKDLMLDGQATTVSF
jgi:uncharacterized lipoprotein YbaY